MKPGRNSEGRGQALVEFALVFPVAILLLVAVFDVGRGVFAYNGLTNAAREGARLAIVNQDKAKIGQRVQDMAPTVAISNLGNLDDLVTFRRSLPNADPTTNAQCTTMAVGCVAVVTARASWQPITPIVGQIIGSIPLVGRSEIQVEFVCPNAAIPAYATSAGCPKQP